MTKRIFVSYFNGFGTEVKSELISEYKFGDYRYAVVWEVNGTKQRIIRLIGMSADNMYEGEVID